MGPLKFNCSLFSISDFYFHTSSITQLHVNLFFSSVVYGSPAYQSQNLLSFKRNLIAFPILLSLTLLFFIVGYEVKFRRKNSGALFHG